MLQACIQCSNSVAYLQARIPQGIKNGFYCRGKFIFNTWFVQKQKIDV